MKTTVLMILDGFGINDRTEGNAIKLAKTPVIDSFIGCMNRLAVNQSQM